MADINVGFKPLSPSVLERAEGLAFFVAAFCLYGQYGRSWWLFAVLFLVPDLTIPIYFVNRRAGAAAYNLVHIYVWPAGLGCIGVVNENDLLISIALIWFAHIGIDRTLGLGLKYPVDFRDTHLQRL
jgi:hypothetical protein